MYYVSEGVPVGLGNGQRQEHVTSATSSRQGGNSASYTTTYGGFYSTQETKKPKRSDSLQSLLSLNVLAAQLLTDHDDLQSVSSCKLLVIKHILPLWKLNVVSAFSASESQSQKSGSITKSKRGVQWHFR